MKNNQRLGSDPLMWLNSGTQSQPATPKAASGSSAQPANTQRIRQDESETVSALGLLLDSVHQCEDTSELLMPDLTLQEKAQVQRSSLGEDFIPGTDQDWNPASILEHLEHPFCVFTSEGEILYANQALCALSGYSQDQLLEINWISDLFLNQHEELLARERALHTQRTTCCRAVLYATPQNPLEVTVHLSQTDDAAGGKYLYAFVEENFAPCAGTAPTGDEACISYEGLQQSLQNMGQYLKYGKKDVYSSKTIEKFRSTIASFTSGVLANGSVFSPLHYNHNRLAACFRICNHMVHSARELPQDTIHLDVHIDQLTTDRTIALLLLFAAYDVLSNTLIPVKHKAHISINVQASANNTLTFSLRGVNEEANKLLSKLKLSKGKRTTLPVMAHHILNQRGILAVISQSTTEIQITLPLDEL